MSSHPLSIRLPRELRRDLTAAAEAERRSLSNLAAALIGDGLVTRRLERLAFEEWHRASRAENE